MRDISAFCEACTGVNAIMLRPYDSDGDFMLTADFEQDAGELSNTFAMINGKQDLRKLCYNGEVGTTYNSIFDQNSGYQSIIDLKGSYLFALIAMLRFIKMEVMCYCV